jgi:hypothetical protein
MEKLFEFKITNKNGTTTIQTIPCRDYMEALRVKDEVLRKASIMCVDVVPIVPDYTKEQIEEAAWKIYQSGIKVRWRMTALRREDFPQYVDYPMFMNSAIGVLLLKKPQIDKPEEKRVMFEITNDDGANDKKKYPVIHVPADGHPEWYGGARAMYFVYSKDHGNFILEGYHREVSEYLKKNYTHYFYRYTYWYNGKSRGGWKFWKDTVGIIAPSKLRKEWKYEIRLWTGGRHYVSVEESNKTKLSLKRLPKRWIPEFDRF